MRSNLIKLLLIICSRLPLPPLHGIGYVLGNLAWFFNNKLKSVTIVNLSLCYPQLSPAERKKLGRQSMIELAKTAMETALLWYSSPEKILSLIKRKNGVEAFEEALAQGRGVIIVSPHIGAWELTGAYFSISNNMTFMYKPPNLEGLEPIVRKARQSHGGQAVPTDARGIKQLFAALKKGQVAGILPDQDPGDKGGVFAPFFGIPTNTMTLLPRLAAKSRAGVFFVFSQRLSWGRGYELHLLPAPQAIYQSDVSISAEAVNQGVEQCIAIQASQYQWSYKRFRRRPENETEDFYRN